MILADANLLLYAYDSQSPFHRRAKSWMEEAFSRSEPFCFSWFTLTAFIRIVTNPRVFQHPLSLGETITILDEWLQMANAVILAPAIIIGLFFEGIFENPKPSVHWPPMRI